MSYYDHYGSSSGYGNSRWPDAEPYLEPYRPGSERRESNPSRQSSRQDRQRHAATSHQQLSNRPRGIYGISENGKHNGMPPSKGEEKPAKDPEKLSSKETSAVDDKKSKRDLPLTQRIARGAQVFAQTCSISGLSYIESSTKRLNRLAWTIVFLGFLGVTCWQLSTLFITYYERPIQTKVGITNGIVSFPSVTICNLNMVRSSKLDLNPELAAFVYSTQDVIADIEEDPDATAARKRKKRHVMDIEPADGITTETPSGGGGTTAASGGGGSATTASSGGSQGTTGATGGEGSTAASGDVTIATSGASEGTTATSETSEGTTATSGASEGTSAASGASEGTTATSGSSEGTTATSEASEGTMATSGETTTSGSSPSSGSTSSAGASTTGNGLGDGIASTTPDYFDYDDFYDLDYVDISADDFFSGEDDPDIANAQTFREYLGRSDLETRREMGHDKNLMILSCTFNGKICYADNFTHSFSKDYGNCYTFNSPLDLDSAYLTRFTGPAYGLSVELFKEDAEYLSSFTTGGGWRVAVHPFGTLPFPYVEGMSISPNTEAFIGVTYSTVSRPGYPYESCDDSDGFHQLYDANYTIEACQATCSAREIIKDCDCYLPENIETYPLNTATQYQSCDVTSQRSCATQATVRVNLGVIQCGCLKACSEKNIDQELSFNQWPDIGLYDTMVNKLCDATEDSANASYYCDTYRNYSSYDGLEALGFDFGRFNVYLKSLTTQVVIEESSYGITRFASDIGGTIGLWMGLSIFSVIEILNFIMHLCKYTYYSMRGQPTSNPQEPDRYFVRNPRHHTDRYIDQQLRDPTDKHFDQQPRAHTNHWPENNGRSPNYEDMYSRQHGRNFY